MQECKQMKADVRIKITVQSDSLKKKKTNCANSSYDFTLQIVKVNTTDGRILVQTMNGKIIETDIFRMLFNMKSRKSAKENL